MKRNKALKNLTLSLAVAAAAGMMLGNVAPAFSLATYDMTAKDFMQQMGQVLEAGDTAQVLEMIRRLRQMGVTSISVNGQMYPLAEIEQLVAEGSQAAITAVVQLAATAQTTRVRFEVDQQEVVAVATQLDVFPTSSMG
jgi:Uncharacterized protein conserved in archaea